MTVHQALARLRANFRSTPSSTLAAVACAAMLLGCARPARSAEKVAAPGGEFPQELLEWSPAPGNPVFAGRGDGAWDKQIRERGWILREGDLYRLWYAGYDGTREAVKQLGYATSTDGVQWTRSANNPLCSGLWLEDMMVVKQADDYFMFAEGSADGEIVLLTSKDGVDWRPRGLLHVRLADGVHEVEKPRGTPTAWVENGVWYLFYERRDLGVWLATTKDPLSRVWTNVQDEPVLELGPSPYDAAQIALDQIIKRDGVYYAFYHGCGDQMPRIWNTNLARSRDLVHWQKYAGNPLLDDKSSAIVVPDAAGYRLYAMHGQVDLFYPSTRKRPALSGVRSFQRSR